MVRFSMKFQHPVYEAAARSFLDWVDVELSECKTICRDFPQQFNRYELLLPQKADRSRIGPKSSSYIYHDLEFTLSRDEVVKLLMTDKLYNSPSLCIRELIQNSLDALRYRKAFYACSNFEWNDGKIEIEHKLDENGYQILECRDNGIGMDEKIITNFFCKVAHGVK